MPAPIRILPWVRTPGSTTQRGIVEMIRRLAPHTTVVVDLSLMEMKRIVEHPETMHTPRDQAIRGVIEAAHEANVRLLGVARQWDRNVAVSRLPAQNRHMVPLVKNIAKKQKQPVIMLMDAFSANGMVHDLTQGKYNARSTWPRGVSGMEKEYIRMGQHGFNDLRKGFRNGSEEIPESAIVLRELAAVRSALEKEKPARAARPYKRPPRRS